MDRGIAAMSSFSDLPDDVVARIACLHCSFRDLPALAAAALSPSLAARCAVDFMRRLSHDKLLLSCSDDDADRTDPHSDPDGADLAFNRCSRMIKLWPSDDRLDIIRYMALLVLPSELDQTMDVASDARDAKGYGYFCGRAIVQTSHVVHARGSKGYGSLCGRAVVPVVVVLLAAAFGLPSVLVDLLDARRPLGLAFHVGPGFCPLFFASLNGHCDTVSSLGDLGTASLDLGGGPDCDDRYFDPLVAAIDAMHFDVAFILLRRCRCNCCSVDYFIHVAIDLPDDDLVWRILDCPNLSVDCLISVLRWALESRSPASIRRLHARSLLLDIPFSVVGDFCFDQIFECSSLSSDDIHIIAGALRISDNHVRYESVRGCALAIAVSLDDMPLVRAVLECDPSSASCVNNAPLLIAISHGRFDIAALLFNSSPLW